MPLRRQDDEDRGATIPPGFLRRGWTSPGPGDAAWLQAAIGLVAGFGTPVVVPGSPVSFRFLGVLVAVTGVWTVIGVTSRRVVSVGGSRGPLVLSGGVAGVAAGLWAGLAPTVDARGLLVATGIGFLGTSVGYFAVAHVETTHPGRQCWFALALTLPVVGLVQPVPERGAVVQHPGIVHGQRRLPHGRSVGRTVHCDGAAMRPDRRGAIPAAGRSATLGRPRG